MASLNPLAGTLGKKLATHLLRRATFGPAKNDIDIWAGNTVSQGVKDLFKALPAYDPPKDPATGADWINPKPTEANSPQEDLKEHLNVWWIDKMCHSGISIGEKMAFFYHTHFTTIKSRIRFAPAIYYQIALFRYYALGNFKEITKKICMDNAMLMHLDGQLNEVGRPNENFGREFLELYSIGKGVQKGPSDYTNYTEEDVVEAARVFSGFGIDEDFTGTDPESGLVRGRVKTGNGTLAARHDAGAKIFSKAFQNTVIEPKEMIDGKATEAAALDEISQLVDMVFDQEETARHICRKLYRFFVYYKISEEIEQDIIIPLAGTFRDNNFEIQPVLEQLLSSQHFYDQDNSVNTDDIVGAVIKSPLELVLGTLRFFKVEITTDADLEKYYETYYRAVIRELKFHGMDFYEPFEVAGYTAYHQAPSYNRNWISANYLAERYKYAENLLNGFYGENDNLLCKLNVMEYVADPKNISDPSNPEKLTRELTEYLLPQEITEERFNYFMNTILLDDLSIMNWKSEWQQYQLTGDDTNVRVQLERLVKAIMQSPEYQLS